MQDNHNQDADGDHDDDGDYDVGDYATLRYFTPLYATSLYLGRPLFHCLNTPVIWLLFVLNFHGYEIANMYLECDQNNRIMPWALAPRVF